MDEKELYKTINEESERGVPDAYDKILFAAHAEGLLNNGGNTEVYSDGETAVLGEVNKKAVAITTLAALAAVSLAIALPIALSGTNGGGVDLPPFGNADNKIVADIDLGDSYAYGAVTTARLAESFLNESTGAKAMAKRSVSGNDFQEFGTYFAALDCLLDKDGVKTSIGEPADYQKSIVISGHRNNGDLFGYAMYYNEYKIVSKSYTEGDPVNYYLEGIVSVEWFSGLHLIGERTMSSAAADAEETALNLYAYPSLNDKTTYAQMQLKTEEVDGVAVKSYSYKVVRGKTTVSEAVAYKPVNDDLVIKIKDGEEDKGVFTVVGKTADGDGYNINYDLGANKGELVVKTSDNGLSYEFPDPAVDNSFLGYRDNGDGTYSISTYDKNAALPETLVIPATYNDKPVVSVGNGALKDASFKKIIVSEGIKEIEESAFENCRQLTDLSLPSTLTKIGMRAFFNCEELKSVSLPSNLTHIGAQAFAHCKNMSAVNFNENLFELGSHAFEECTSLTAVQLPASLTNLHPRAFASCSSLISITVDENNKHHYVEGNCVISKDNNCVEIGLKNGVIPEGVTSIGDYAFYGVGLTKLQLPNSVTEIGAYAFAENAFTAVTLHDNVTVIGEYAFARCNNLESVTLPANLKTIQRSAFERCLKLKSVHIPAKVSQIGKMAFAGCDELDSITVDASNTVYHSKDNCIINTKSKVLVAGCKTSVIPDDGSVQTIGEAAFMYCNFTQVTIPSAVTKLEENAFNCSDLTQVIMEGVTDIGPGAFQACDELQSVEFCKNLKVIGGHSFANCYALTGISLPEGLTTIEELAFWDCLALEEVTLPSTLTDVGPQVFKDCRALKTAVLSEGITHVYLRMFHCCEWLESVTIPKSVKVIDAQAFYGCKNCATINYAGTMQEWESIVKGEGWDFECPHTIFCTDGQI